jgi:WD40 repeat protein
MRTFGENLSKYYDHIYDGYFFDIKWSPNSDGLYFLGGDNIIFKAPITEDTLEIIYSTDKDNTRIRNFSFSNENKYFSISRWIDYGEFSRYEVILLDKENITEHIIFTSDIPIRVGGWSDIDKYYNI